MLPAAIRFMGTLRLHFCQRVPILFYPSWLCQRLILAKTVLQMALLPPHDCCRNLKHQHRNVVLRFVAQDLSCFHKQC